jgi:hypothetical protein
MERKGWFWIGLPIPRYVVTTGNRIEQDKK